MKNRENQPPRDFSPRPSEGPPARNCVEGGGGGEVEEEGGREGRLGGGGGGEEGEQAAKLTAKLAIVAAILEQPALGEN